MGLQVSSVLWEFLCLSRPLNIKVFVLILVTPQPGQQEKLTLRTPQPGQEEKLTLRARWVMGTQALRGPEAAEPQAWVPVRQRSKTGEWSQLRRGQRLGKARQTP